MGAKERNIGKNAEREIVHLTHGRFRHRTGTMLEARTGRQHRGGPDSPDVITNLTGVHWEITRNHGVRPGHQGMRDKLMKAAEDAGRDQVPFVFWRPKGDTRWRVTFYAALIYTTANGGGQAVITPRSPLTCPSIEHLQEVTLWLEAALIVMGCEQCIEVAEGSS